jgi:hypothetical protein
MDLTRGVFEADPIVVGMLVAVLTVGAVVYLLVAELRPRSASRSRPAPGAEMAPRGGSGYPARS